MFGKSSQQKLAPYRSQSTDLTGFPTPHDKAPTERYFRTDLNNRVQSCIYIKSRMYIHKKSFATLEIFFLH